MILRNPVSEYKVMICFYCLFISGLALAECGREVSSGVQLVLAVDVSFPRTATLKSMRRFWRVRATCCLPGRLPLLVAAASRSCRADIEE